MATDPPFTRLPPTVLDPTPNPTTVVAGQTDKPQPTSRWIGTLQSGNKTTGFIVHLFADPVDHTVTCGCDISLPSTGTTVVVGFFSDDSVSIVGTV